MTTPAFLFDIDGTLVDSNEFHVLAWQRAFRAVGRELSREEIHAQIGKGGDQLIPSLLPPAEARRHQERLDALHTEIFARDYLPRVQPFPAVRELFALLHGAGTRVALASSAKKAEVEHYVELLGVADLIEAATSADDVDCSKPCPDVFQAALERVHRQEAIVVGDTPYDAEAAGKAGLRAIGVLSGGFGEEALRAAGASAVFRDVADLLKHYDALTTFGEAACASAGKASSIHRKTRRI